MHRYLPTDEKIRVFGRTKLQNPLPLFWTGSGIEFEVTGTEGYITFITDYSVFEQWIRVDINGAPVIRQMLPKGESRVCLFRGNNRDTKRRIRIYKEAQAMPTDPVTCLLIASVETNGELIDIEHTYDYKIEFIGDSLTCGEGLAGNRDMMEWMPEQMSTLGNYALETAAELNAEPSLLSLGGWGVYHSWDSKKECNMTDHYEEICSVVNGDANITRGAHDPYDFAGWKADAVVVNLGTNDASGFHEDFSPENVKLLRDKIHEFLAKIRKNRPDAGIFWAYGMCGRVAEPYIREAVDSFAKETGDGKIQYVALPDEQDFGSRSHPGKKTHRASAEALVSAIRSTLN